MICGQKKSMNVFLAIATNLLQWLKDCFCGPGSHFWKKWIDPHKNWPIHGASYRRKTGTDAPCQKLKIHSKEQNSGSQHPKTCCSICSCTQYEGHTRPPLMAPMFTASSPRSISSLLSGVCRWIWLQWCYPTVVMCFHQSIRDTRPQGQAVMKCC